MTSQSRLRRYRQGLLDLPAVLAALGVAIVVEIGLRVTTLPRLARALGAPLDTEDPERDTAPLITGQPSTLPLPAEAKRQVRATRLALRHWPFGDTCLRRALVSGQRLRRFNPTLHVGVAKVGSEVRAHAWIALGGVVIDPLRAASSYLLLASPPSDPLA
jgi:Transglutaminase-like superfamily